MKGNFKKPRFCVLTYFPSAKPIFLLKKPKKSRSIIRHRSKSSSKSEPRKGTQGGRQDRKQWIRIIRIQCKRSDAEKYGNRNLYGPNLCHRLDRTSGKLWCFFGKCDQQPAEPSNTSVESLLWHKSGNQMQSDKHCQILWKMDGRMELNKRDTFPF